MLTGIILIDLQKAFDTISHEILLKKLDATGFFDKCIRRWFQSYLCERIFFTEIENQLIDYGKVLGGVPKVLFQDHCCSLFMSRICLRLQNQIYLYMLMTHASCTNIEMPKKIEKQLNRNFENVCNWFVDNKLSIHFGEDKTKSICK